MWQVEGGTQDNAETKVITLRQHKTSINGQETIVIIVRDVTDSVRFVE